MSLKDFLKKDVEFARFLYFPLTTKQRKLYLSILQSRVDHFIPKMEEMTKIELGSVKVEPMSQFFENYYQKSISELIIEKEPGYDKTLNYKFMSYAISIATSLVKTLHHPFYFIRGALMKYHEDKIHTPFHLYNRLKYPSLIKNNNLLDDVIVHELSHHLWNKINPAKNNGYFYIEDSWSEGFADYCMNDYFNKKGFYENTKPEISYTEHYNKVKNFLDKNGEVSLLEIPKNWQEFEKILN